MARRVSKSLSAPADPGTRIKWPGSWYRVKGIIPRQAEDDAVGLAELWGGLGGEMRPSGPSRLEYTAWFEKETEARGFAERLKRLRPGPAFPAVDKVEDDGWLEACLTPRPPITAGRFVIHDGLSPVPAEAGRGRRHILIPPGRAFGTGEHSTTRLCLDLLSRALKKAERVADVGTGSGILAIAAAKGGAESVEAVDNDPAVLEVARENLEQNGVQQLVRLHQGSWQDLQTAARFHVMLANIHRSALLRGARAMSRRLEPWGRAILSGFLFQDLEMVVEAWSRQGCRLLDAPRDGEWVAVLLEKPERKTGEC